MLCIHTYTYDETFRELNFRCLRPIHENCENYAPRKFGVIRYVHCVSKHVIMCMFCTFIQIPQHSGGDVIRVLDDIATVHDLQEGHGGWVDDMALVN